MTSFLLPLQQPPNVFIAWEYRIVSYACERLANVQDSSRMGSLLEKKAVKFRENSYQQWIWKAKLIRHYLYTVTVRGTLLHHVGKRLSTYAGVQFHHRNHAIFATRPRIFSFLFSLFFSRYEAQLTSAPSLQSNSRPYDTWSRAGKRHEQRGGIWPKQAIKCDWMIACCCALGRWNWNKVALPFLCLF